MDTLSLEVQQEPRLALDGGETGMDFYRAIVKNGVSSLSPDGFFLFEIGYDQGIAIKNLAKEYGMACTVFRDYGGNDRVAYLTKS